MLSKVCVPFQQKESPCAVKTILMILSVFLSLALIVTLFYSFFKKCDRLKFSFHHKCQKESVDSAPTDTEIPLAADAPTDETAE